MERLVLMPNDKVVIKATGILSNEDKKVITLLYQPLFGIESYSLYMTMWDLLYYDKLSSQQITHKLLLTLFNFDIKKFEQFRNRLEALNLLDVYYNNEDEYYTYLLKNPVSAKVFFKDGNLSLYLNNKIGDVYFKNLLERFLIEHPNIEENINLTKRFDEVFRTSANPPMEPVSGFIRSKTKSDLPKFSQVSFDSELYMSLLSKNFIKSEKISEDTINLIANTAMIYDYSEQVMAQITLDATDANGQIDLNLLRKIANQNYEKLKVKNNKVKNDKDTSVRNVGLNRFSEVHKPTNINSETLKRVEKSEDKLIKFYSSITPREFLKFKSNGNEPVSEDLKVIELLKNQYQLTDPMVNIIIDYVLIAYNNRFTRYDCIREIGEWKRAGVNTPEDAMKYVKSKRERYKQYKDNKKTTGTNYANYNKRAIKDNEKLPDWYEPINNVKSKNDDINESNKVNESTEDIKDLKDLIKEL